MYIFVILDLISLLLLCNLFNFLIRIFEYLVVKLEVKLKDSMRLHL